jgi:uncharacterized protein involved in outer membrane biogenesis
MKTLFRVLIGVIVLVVVALIAVAVAVATLDPNDHKDWIAAKAKENTGRTVRLDGDIGISWYPWLGLELNNVTVANAAGFGDEPFLRFDHFKARVKLVPLLRNQYEVDTVRLHGAIVNLERNASGAGNWEDLMKPRARKRALPLTGIVLGGVDIQDANITLSDAASGAQHRISGLDFSTGELIYGEPINLSVSMQATSSQPQLDGDVSVQGIIAYDLDAQQYRLDPLQINGNLRGKNVPGGQTAITLGAVAAADLKTDTVTISDLKLSALDSEVSGEAAVERAGTPEPAVKAALSARGRDLALLFKVFEIEPLAGQLAQLDERSFNVKSAVDADLKRGDVNLSDLTAEVLGATIRGAVAGRNVRSDAPGFKGNIDASGPNLPALMQVIGQFQGGRDSPMARAGRRLADTPQKAFSAKAEFDADMKAGTLEVPELSAKLVGATINGTLRGREIRSETPGLKGRLSASGPDLSPLMLAAGEFHQGGKSPLIRAGRQVARAAQKSFSAKLEFDADLKAGTVEVPELAAELLGATISGMLQARDIRSDKPGYKGHLNAAGPDLPALMRIAGEFQEAEPRTLAEYGKRLAGAPAKSFDIRAQFDADLKKGDIDLPALAAQGLGVNLSGNLKARNMESPKGTIEGRITMAGENMPPLLKAMEREDLADVVRSIRFETAVSGSRSSLMLKPLTVNAVVAGEQVGKKPVEVALKADTRLNLDAEEIDLTGLSLQGLGMDVRGNVTATRFKSAPEVRGRIDVAPFNLRQVMRQLNQKLPDMADDKALNRVALQSEFSGSTSALNLSKVAMVLDESKIEGDFAVSEYEKPTIRFGIRIDRINADRYLPPPDKAQAKPVAQAKQPKKKDTKKTKQEPLTPETAAAAAATQLPVELLRSIDVQGNLEIGSLIISNAKLNNVKLVVDGRDGKVRMDPVAAALYEGSYSGNVAINATGKVPRLTFNSKLTGVQAEPLLKDMRGQAKLRGKGDFSAALVAAGADTEALKRSLSGQMSFAFRDGAVKGFNIGRMLRSVRQFSQAGSFGVSEKEETDFTELTGNPVAEKGIIRLDDLDAKAPAFRVSGKGVLADLPRNRIDYVASTTVARTAEGQAGAELAQLSGVTIPIQIKGSLDDPKISPDFASVGLSFAREQLLDRLAPKPAEEAPAEEAAPAKDPAKELLDKTLKSIFQ